MELSYKDIPHNKIDYFVLHNGRVDVFLHKNEETELGEDGNTVYVAEEVYFQVDSLTTKDMIEEKFDSYWENEGERVVEEATTEERVEMLEDTINFLLGL